MESYLIQNGSNNMKKKTIIILVSLSFFFPSWLLRGKENQLKDEKADYSIENFDVLSGWSSISFFLSGPTNIIGLSKEKKKDLAILELEKWGQVVQKKLSLLDPFEGGDTLSVLFTNPSLTYVIEEVDDIEGRALPILKATLKFEAATTVHHNKMYCHPLLWSRSCYIQSNALRQPEAIFSKTLSELLKEFEAEYVKANQINPIKPMIYIAGL